MEVRRKQGLHPLQVSPAAGGSPPATAPLAVMSSLSILVSATPAVGEISHRVDKTRLVAHLLHGKSGLPRSGLCPCEQCKSQGSAQSRSRLGDSSNPHSPLITSVPVQCPQLR